MTEVFPDVYSPEQSDADLDASNGSMSPTLLNAQAAEFVPKSVWNVCVEEFVPKSAEQSSESSQGFSQAQSMSSEPSGPVAEVEALVESLVFSPGGFELVAQQMFDVIADYVEDVETLNLVIDVIVDTCLTDPNFRVTGARLLNLLAAMLLVTPFETQTFGSVLMDKCESMHAKAMAAAASEPRRLRSLTLFAADLCLRLGGVYLPEDFRARVPVIDMLNAMLTATISSRVKLDDARENFKVIVQMLQLFGVIMETEERGSNPTGATPKMDRLIAKMSSASKDPSVMMWLPADLDQMITSVVELREANWGQPLPADVEGSGEFVDAESNDAEFVDAESNGAEFGDAESSDPEFVDAKSNDPESNYAEFMDAEGTNADQEQYIENTTDESDNVPLAKELQVSNKKISFLEEVLHVLRGKL